MATQRFPLHTPRALYWGIPFFGVAAVLFAVFLATEKRGLVIWDAIHLGPAEARVLWGVGLVGSLAFMVLVGMSVRVMRGRQLAVELDDDSIVVPGSLLRGRSHRFAFSELASAKVFRFRGHEVLMLVGPPGRKSVARSQVGNAAFDAIAAHVLARLPGPRAALPVAKLR